MRHILFTLIIFFAASGIAADEQPDFTKEDFPRWIEAFKHSAKGPFEKTVWFCNDGAVLPAEPGACATHGGGIQHGQWNEQALILRDSGYYIANILAAVDVEALLGADEDRERLRQILLERYLMAIDNGWIFRGARYHRGVMQIEDELTGARRLLIALSQAQAEHHRDFLLLRVTAKLLPHGEESADVAQVRQLATQLGERDMGFEMLRNKIHSQPDAGDATRVRDYVILNMVDDATDYQLLADTIDKVYHPERLDSLLATLVRSLPRKKIANQVNRARSQLRNNQDPAARLQLAAKLMLVLRNEFPRLTTPIQWMDALEASLALEREVFTAGAVLRPSFSELSRRQLITLLKDVVNALYGSGELSVRQWKNMSYALQRLVRDNISLSEYRQHLRYLSRLSGWIDRHYQFQFATTVAHLATIEPRITPFIPDQLRGSVLLVGSALLDNLTIDANRLVGVGHVVLGTQVGSGLRMLNPGLARGMLNTAPPSPTQEFQAEAIYVLPETTAELPPIAGILTLGEGNTLSHIQILARNLGIPNVVIDERVHRLLRQHDGQTVVMAVSPGGRVQIERDSPQWNSIFGNADPVAHGLIDADVQKLDLQVRELFSLEQLRASDAGRIVGPKAANLGELQHQFPGHVPKGIVIPFGVFYNLLQQPRDVSGQPLFEWMQAEYRRMDLLDGKPLHLAQKEFLKTVREWILSSDPGPEFWMKLRDTLRQHLGDDEDFTLFVRSDTNMEDLPGFTGAGLNLTVPNVKGFDALIEAIKRVWASPFSDRAFEWRQGRMWHPEHVYVSLLLMPSVAVDKSGVMVTTDVTADQPGWITVATNEGIGGAVQGESAEELRINLKNDQIQLLAEASNPTRRILNAEGGLVRVPVSGKKNILSEKNIQQIRWLARELPRRIPMRDEQGESTAIDVEFGFYENQLILFQARPYLANHSAQKNRYLKDMDAGMQDSMQQRVNLDEVLLE
jgi:hypothetical protein